ncbi:MAG: hypothetical protein V4760_19710 [Bdellovibrionota bacterium]
MSRIASFAFAALVACSVFVSGSAHAYLDVYPNRVNFLDQYVNEMSFPERITVTNYYGQTIVLRTYNNCFMDFQIDDYDCKSPIPHGGRCDIKVRFWPASAGWKWCTLDIDHQFGGFTRIDIQGTAIERTPLAR